MPANTEENRPHNNSDSSLFKNAYVLRDCWASPSVFFWFAFQMFFFGGEF